MNRAASQIVGALLLLSTVLPALALVGHPVVAFAQSASMVPAMEVGDGFFVDPLARDVDVGDIVLYQSTLNGEGLAVHRIVAKQDGGFVTQGDANSLTDQAAGEPLVTADVLRGRVVADAAGDPVVVPGLGLPILNMQIAARSLVYAVGSPAQAMAVLVAALGGLFLLVPDRVMRRRFVRPRFLHNVSWLPNRWRGQHAGLAFFALMVTGSVISASDAGFDVTVAMVVAPGLENANGNAAPPGVAVERTVEVNPLFGLPTVAIADSKTAGVSVAATSIKIPVGERGAYTVRQTAGETTGIQEDVVRVARYPAYLPEGAIATLHEIRPGAPFMVFGALLSGIGAVWWRAIGVGRVPLDALLDGGGHR